MLKKTITWTDYEGNERTEDFYFNINKAELVLMQVSESGGLDKLLKRIVAETDVQKIIEIFKDVVLKAYGQKSPDGRRFIKSKELSKEFEETEAYVQIFMGLATNTNAAIDFVNGIMPPTEKKSGDVLPVIDRKE